MSLTNTGYFHGSKINTLVEFDLSYAEIDHPFGPAIYLTKEKIVASCYSQREGSIYCVSLSDNLKNTINLDATYTSQTQEVQNILTKMFSNNELKEVVDLRKLIHPPGSNLKDMNSRLIANGIWMIYGLLSPEEFGGLPDRGIQYAVLDKTCLCITDTTNYWT